MVINRIKPSGLIFLFTLIGFAGVALGNPQPPLVFVPSTADYNGTHGEFFGTSTWTHTVGAAWGSTNAHADNGFVWVDVQAMLGGSSASSWQGVEFDVNLPSTVTAEVNMSYVGNAVNFEAAAFSSISWEWQLEKLKDPNKYTWIVVGRQRNDIISAFSLTVLAEKVAETLLAGITAYYGEEFDIPGIEAYGTQQEFKQSFYELTQTLYNAYLDYNANYEKLHKTFKFTVDPGTYHLFVGARGDCSGFVLGAGFALMYAQVENITLTLDDGYSGKPDLIIQSLNVPDPVFGPSLLLTEFQKGETVTFDVVVANIGTVPAQGTTYTFDVCEPNAADYNTVAYSPSSVIILPHSSCHFNPVYTFTKKGFYSFRAIADEPNSVAESDENNNELIQQYYVRGLPPDKPQKPSVLGAYCSGEVLYRNNDVTICTSATDPENDPLKYQFFFHCADANENEVYSIPWDPNSIRGWSDCNCMPFSPYGITDRSAEGAYYVWARAIDTDGLMSEPSDQRYFVVATNQAPEFNEIDVPDQAYLGSTVPFTVSCSDQEKDLIHYQFGWCDNTPPTDCCSVKSGDSVTVEHTFNANLGEGQHSVVVYAIDTFGATSYYNLSIALNNYVAPFGTITVETNMPISTFDIAGPNGPNQFSGSGTFWATEANQAGVGWYTITFHDVNLYNTPQSSTQYLEKGQSIIFEGQYTHKTGTIQVNTNIDSAFYTIIGHFDAKGQNMNVIGREFGPWTTYAGDYSIQYHSVPGYCLPATNGEEKTLQGNQNLVFNGRYTRPPVALLDVNMPARGFAIAGEDMVEFDASASYSPEADLSITKYVFYFGDGEMYTESFRCKRPGRQLRRKSFSCLRRVRLLHP